MAKVYLMACRERGTGEVRAARLGWHAPTDEQREQGWSVVEQAVEATTPKALRLMFDRLASSVDPHVVAALPESAKAALSDHTCCAECAAASDLKAVAS